MNDQPSPADSHNWAALTHALHVATQAAAFAAVSWRGKGDNIAADQAAVEAMRFAIKNLPVQGRVAIGEGERDKAPMLYCGETFGQQNAQLAIDIAVDPLEGTTLTAENRPDAISIIAASKKDHMLRAPDVYMKKFATSVQLPRGIISFEKSVLHNINALAQFMGKPLENMAVSCLDRERHYHDINALREKGVRVMLLQDGDIKAAIETSLPGTLSDAYFGIGGAPEGVIAACALQCTNGFFMGQLQPKNQEEIAKIKNTGIKDPNTIYYCDDLASPKSPIIVVATGVTRSSYLGPLNIKGVSAIDPKTRICTLDSIIFKHMPGAYAYWQNVSSNFNHQSLEALANKK
jgi:fructose-1,6-bisphosphatase II / sedoheptulose-1,7-bisphosphatase